MDEVDDAAEYGVAGVDGRGVVCLDAGEFLADYVEEVYGCLTLLADSVGLFK